jgi:hypothetical protein
MLIVRNENYFFIQFACEFFPTITTLASLFCDLTPRTHRVPINESLAGKMLGDNLVDPLCIIGDTLASQVAVNNENPIFFYANDFKVSVFHNPIRT